MKATDKLRLKASSNFNGSPLANEYNKLNAPYFSNKSEIPAAFSSDDGSRVKDLDSLVQKFSTSIKKNLLLRMPPPRSSYRLR